MSMCDRCIHSEVCGLEDNHEEALTHCRDFRGWIPVSERLPEENRLYLVCLDTIGFPHISIDEYVVNECKWESFGKCVMAWMPLPELCKVESE